MEEIILSLCKKLNTAIKNDVNFKQLDILEKEMNNNEEVIKLSYKKDVACAHYSDLLKIYKENDPEVSLALKELNSAKKDLDTHPLVSKYLKTYSEVRKILFEMNNILFSEFTSKECK